MILCAGNQEIRTSTANAKSDCPRRSTVSLPGKLHGNKELQLLLCFLFQNPLNFGNFGNPEFQFKLLR
jgi:hypothetical protein